MNHSSLALVLLASIVMTVSSATLITPCPTFLQVSSALTALSTTTNITQTAQNLYALALSGNNVQVTYQVSCNVAASVIRSTCFIRSARSPYETNTAIHPQCTSPIATLIIPTVNPLSNTFTCSALRIINVLVCGNPKVNDCLVSPTIASTSSLSNCLTAALFPQLL